MQTGIYKGFFCLHERSGKAASKIPRVLTPLVFFCVYFQMIYCPQTAHLPKVSHLIYQPFPFACLDIGVHKHQLLFLQNHVLNAL